MATSFEKLETVEKRYLEIESLMAQPEVISNLQRLQALARERASLEEQVAMYRGYKKTTQAIADTETIIEEEKDEELVRMAREEMETLTNHLGTLEEKLKLTLLPQDPNASKDVIVEIRGGAGGEEAALFAGDLFRMYSRYAERKGWRTELVSQSESGIGGFKEVIFEVKGKGAYSRLKYESGVHRVQRVPETEASGRIHTSTATVAVLPEMEEVDVDINQDELRIDIYHASGHGGQNVQKVATAVRITHMPTSIVVTCQDERSQLKNKLKAMAVLRARLYDMKQREQQEQITETRRSQVGTGDRSEKIRTYNFPQDRLSDHRIDFTAHGLPRIMDGELDPVIDALTAEEQALRLAEALG